MFNLKNEKMKKQIRRFTLLLLMAMPLFLFAQDVQNIRGKYIGTIEENGTIHTYRLLFSDQGFAYQCNSKWDKLSFNTKKTTSTGNTTNLQWMNKGGAWTETQLFSIVKVSNTLLRVIHLRHVVNKGKESKSWFYSGEGTFIKVE